MGALVRKETYPVEEVIPHVQFKPKKEGADSTVVFDGDPINMASDRYKLFATKGCTCCSCGVEGVFFAKEQHSSDRHKFHFNLYALNVDGQEILMTKDHIVAHSEGGPDQMSNYQVMCTTCNSLKSRAEGADRDIRKHLHKAASHWGRVRSQMEPNSVATMKLKQKIDLAQALFALLPQEIEPPREKKKRRTGKEWREKWQKKKSKKKLEE